MKAIRLRSARSILALAALVLFSGCLKLDTTTNGLAIIVVVSGNNQTIPVGTTSTTPLIIRCYDQSAAPLPNQQITWAVQGTGTLSASSTITDQYGESSVLFTSGATPGTVSVTATTEGLTVTFTLTTT